MPKKTESGEKPTLEQNLERLDELIAVLEDEETGLEDAFHTYKEGMELIRVCNAQIDTVEKQVLQLSDTGETAPFEE
ncbi:MAG: exodeoxyribonuclease VII small subunit [Lachnospiraceae bacterium]|nr:exodeoxyribonuclease VII small subunit [Lachnospiraceae bacterium]MCR5477225.1 exodeoxyribonuclease VII small subunit [Lachnospiraceae bacterium]